MKEGKGMLKLKKGRGRRENMGSAHTTTRRGGHEEPTMDVKGEERGIGKM